VDVTELEIVSTLLSSFIRIATVDMHFRMDLQQKYRKTRVVMIWKILSRIYHPSGESFASSSV
jgi:hypothetical protein